MIKSILRMSAVSLLAVVIGSLPCQAPAQSARKSGTEAKASTESAAEIKQPKLPYKGTLTAVDRAAKTMTIGKRTFQITPETKLLREGKPATMEDGVKGEYISLSYQKIADGKFLACNVYYGGKDGKGAVRKSGKSANAQK
ncbi:MAG: hypothetical protein NTX51_06115 [Verrucomicrobia bacterium]|nr:hypothetical protein [Verrucomicrobiota bacterium]